MCRNLREGVGEQASQEEPCVDPGPSMQSIVIANPPGEDDETGYPSQIVS